MLENSQRVKTRNCKRLWRKSIKRVESNEAHVSGRGGKDAKNSPQRRCFLPPFHRYLRYIR
jgi:hypothetical protein